MKNKALKYTVAGLIAFLLVFGVYQMGAKSQSENKKTAPTEEIKSVGILQFVSHPALDQITEGIKEGLKEAGFEEGKNLNIHFQNGQADQSKLDTMSQQLVQDKSDVLVGVATPAAQALANTTDKLPVLMGAVTDPVSANLVKSMDEPGGNITGVSDQPPVAATIQLAQKLLPQAKKVGLLYSASEANSKSQVAEAQKACEKLGLTTETKAVTSTNEIAQSVQVLAGSVDFIYIPLDNTIASAMETVVSEADKQATPIIPSVDTMVSQGGLATVGVNQKALGVETGKMAAKILKGEATPATTPVFTFKEGDTIINEEQAQKFGIQLTEELKKGAKLVKTTKGE